MTFTLTFPGQMWRQEQDWLPDCSAAWPSSTGTSRWSSSWSWCYVLIQRATTSFCGDDKSILTCFFLQISWVRREDVVILSHGTTVFTSDNRFSVILIMVFIFFVVMVIFSYFLFPCLKLCQLSTSFTQGVPENLLHQSRTAWCKISMWFVHTTNVVPVVSQIVERSKSWKNASKIQIGFIVLQSLHGFLLPLIKTLHELQIAKQSQGKHQ